MSAARVLDLGLVARLLGEGASVTARDSDGLTALHWAVLTPVRGLRERQQAMGVRMLVEGGSDVNAQTNEGATPLMFAAGNGQMLATKELLGAGADADNTDDDGRGATQWADDAGHGAIATIL